MESRQILLTVLMLVYCAKLGLSLDCYQCSGSVDDCNNVTAKTQTCLAGQDRCSKVMTTKDGEQIVILGCANLNDCEAGTKSCTEAEKQVRTTCKAECCLTEKCNTPPPKVTNLKCFECQSAMSMEHCIQNSKAVTCSSGEDRCAKFTSELVMEDQKLMVYRKGCRSEATCKKDKDFFLQECGDDDTCDNLCCSNDLCNAGSFSTVSVTFMFISLLMAVVFM